MFFYSSRFTFIAMLLYSHLSKRYQEISNYSIFCLQKALTQRILLQVTQPQPVGKSCTTQTPSKKNCAYTIISIQILSSLSFETIASTIPNICDLTVHYRSLFKYIFKSSINFFSQQLHVLYCAQFSHTVISCQIIEDPNVFQIFEKI